MKRPKPNARWSQIICLAPLCAVLLAPVEASAQSQDALLNKLVEKGILTTKEAEDLKAEAASGFEKSARKLSTTPDWVTGVKFSGDFRARYEGFVFDHEDATDRHRYRYRARFGVKVSLFEDFEVGLRLASGESNTNPTSRNTTFSDNASTKPLFIDQAYAKWNAISEGDWGLSMTAGKMANPYVFSTMVFDDDYTPEGFSAHIGRKLGERHHAGLTLGAFVLDEFSGDSNDPYLLGAQLRVDSKWSKPVQTTAGLAILSIANAEGLVNKEVPNINAGNTRIGPDGVLAHNFNPVIADAALTYQLESFPGYPGAFPIRLGGEVMHNPAADDDNDAWGAGVTFGKAGKKGTWQVSYRYQRLERDAWYEEVIDGDFGAFNPTPPANSGVTKSGYLAGTNVKGHIIKASYSPYDFLVFNSTLSLVELIDRAPGDSDTDTARFQLDAVFKF